MQTIEKAFRVVFSSVVEELFCLRSGVVAGFSLGALLIVGRELICIESFSRALPQGASAYLFYLRPVGVNFSRNLRFSKSLTTDRRVVKVAVQKCR